MDNHGMNRPRATLLASAAVLVVGLPAALSYATPRWTLAGAPLLDHYDLIFGTLGLITAALAISLTAGWIAARQGLLEELGEGRWFRWLHSLALKAIIPVVLVVNLVVRAVRALLGM
jgi:SNF family Na+-dependent transporter